MKLPRIPTNEKTVKLHLSYRESTVQLLEQYAQLYEKTHGAKIAPKDLTEQMLRTFMQEDKDFQKFLQAERQEQGKQKQQQQPTAPPAAI